MDDLRTSLRAAAAAPAHEMSVVDLQQELHRRRQQSRRVLAGSFAVLVVMAVVVAFTVNRAGSPGSLQTIDQPTSAPRVSTSTPASSSDGAISPTIDVTQAGPGWTLTQTVSGERQVVAIVAPDGTSKVIADLTGAAGEDLGILVDWSGDHQRALFDSRDGSHLTEMDLVSGATHTIDVAGQGHYTTPSGQAVVVWAEQDGVPRAVSLRRLALDGTVQLEYPASFDTVGMATASLLYAPDGGSLVVGAQRGFAVLSNDGTLLRELDLGAFGSSSCTPLRWWTQNEVLASCSSGLVRVPVSGDPPTALTAPLSGSGPVYGYGTAFRVAGDVFVQQYGACGTRYLGRLAADGTSTQIDIPGFDSNANVELFGTDGHRLLLGVDDASGDCGGHQTVLWLDPASGAETVVQVNADAATLAIAFPTPDG